MNGIRKLMAAGSICLALAAAATALAPSAQALNPPQRTVQGVVNHEYWQLTKFWGDILNYYGYRSSNPTVDYYNYKRGGRVVNFRGSCDHTRNNIGTEGFYCDGGHIYLDLRQQQGNLRRIGDGSPAVWLAHEFAHHVQYLAGVKFRAPWLELNADCLAGMYFRYGVDYTGLLNAGDVREAQISLRGAGGDKAHGTGKQRVRAFNYGYAAFDWASCNKYW